jgi:hypothetical protein
VKRVRSGAMIVMKSVDVVSITSSAYGCRARLGSAMVTASTTNGLTAMDVATTMLRAAASRSTSVRASVDSQTVATPVSSAMKITCSAKSRAAMLQPRTIDLIRASRRPANRDRLTIDAAPGGRREQYERKLARSRRPPHAGSIAGAPSTT